MVRRSVHQVRALDVLSAVRHGGASPAAEATTAATDAEVPAVRTAIPAEMLEEGALLQAAFPHARRCGGAASSSTPRRLVG
jgi:hypothetical protein